MIFERQQFQPNLCAKPVQGALLQKSPLLQKSAVSIPIHPPFGMRGLGLLDFWAWKMCVLIESIELGSFTHFPVGLSNQYNLCIPQKGIY